MFSTKEIHRGHTGGIEETEKKHRQRQKRGRRNTQQFQEEFEALEWWLIFSLFRRLTSISMIFLKVDPKLIWKVSSQLCLSHLSFLLSIYIGKIINFLKNFSSCYLTLVVTSSSLTL